jgi:cyclopropane-fatty-acyl-phospholipid synthase
MFEHVVESAVPSYFATVFQLLRPEGLFLNHAIASRPGTYRDVTVRAAARLLDRFLVGNLAFRTRYVFPDGKLRPVSEANLVAEQAGFELRDVENLREHYGLTLRHWLERLRSNREEALALVGEPMYRLWEMYLAGSAYHFETARITVNQSLLAKAPVGAATSLPRTRTELYTEPLVGR